MTVAGEIGVWVGSGGFLLGAYALISGFRNIEYEGTRPYAGWVTRTRKRKDGRRTEETYFTRGQAGVKGHFPKTQGRLLYLASAMIVVSLFIH